MILKYLGLLCRFIFFIICFFFSNKETATERINNLLKVVASNWHDWSLDHPTSKQCISHSTFLPFGGSASGRVGGGIHANGNRIRKDRERTWRKNLKNSVTLDLFSGFIDGEMKWQWHLKIVMLVMTLTTRINKANISH